MLEAYPLLLAGGFIGLISVILIVAYASIKDKKQAIGFDRHMKDGEIIRRLLRYAKPYAGSFVLVGFIMLFGIAYDIVSPLIIGQKEEGYCCSFESFAFLNLGYREYRQLGPGEIAVVTPEEVRTLCPPGDKMRICTFLSMPASMSFRSIWPLRYCSINSSASAPWPMPPSSSEDVSG